MKRLVLLFSFSIINLICLAQSEWLTYVDKNDRVGIKFKYPPSYTIRFVEGGVCIDFPKALRSGTAWCIWPVDTVNNISINEAIKNATDLVGETIKYEEERDGISVGGSKALRVIIRNAKSREAIAELVFLVSNNDIYEIECWNMHDADMKSFLDNITLR